MEQICILQCLDGYFRGVVVFGVEDVRVDRGTERTTRHTKVCPVPLVTAKLTYASTGKRVIAGTMSLGSAEDNRKRAVQRSEKRMIG